jgi:hypothetical protein
MGASSNRILTALAMGLPLLTDGLDSYNKYSQYFTEISLKAIQEFTSNPMTNKDLIIKAQKTIAEKYTTAVVSKNWVSVFTSLLNEVPN